MARLSKSKLGACTPVLTTILKSSTSQGELLRNLSSFSRAKKAFMCINSHDKDGQKMKRILFGQEGGAFREPDISFIPCIPKQLTPENQHLADTECIADYNDPKSPYSLEARLQKSKDYLGRPIINVLANSQRFDLQEYGDKKIVSESTMFVR